LALEVVKQDYSGKIREVTLGTGAKTVTVGGATSYPFHLFEGALPHPPRIAWEVWDADTEPWPDACKEPFADVLKDPAAWAKKLVEKFGAELIALKLVSIDPNGKNADAASAVETVKKVLAAVSVPVLVYGVNNVEKDAEVLRKVAEACEGKNLVLGPVQEQNHKPLGAGAIGFKHTVLASTPIDVNLAKQLNTLLANLGVKESNLLMDPTTGGLGYGIEYTYSVMERDRMAALVQQDEKMQQPLVCNLAPEVWKTKEAKSEDPKLGNPRTRGITLEAMTATLLLLAGADILVMRHPEAVAQIQALIKELM
jgi:acetyl-CoA decarbonylase/synthase complex subunit delta